MVRTNLLGALYFAHPLARAMSARGRGHLVFMASIAGLVPVPGETVYSASKFGLVGLAEALSIELEPRGVHVLTVCPGAVRTGFVPDDELARIPDAAKKTMIEPEAVVDATMRALERGTHRIVVMRHGRVVETGLTDQVLDDPREPYTQLLVASILQA